MVLVVLIALRNDPKLLLMAPAPTAAHLHHVETLNQNTVLMPAHKHSVSRPAQTRQAAYAGGFRINCKPGPFTARTANAVWRAAWENFCDGANNGGSETQLEFILLVWDAGLDVRPTTLGGYIMDVIPIPEIDHI